MAQIGTIRLETQNNGTVSVPVFNTGDSGSSVYEFVRVQTASGVGFIPVVDPADASFPYLRVQSQNQGVVAVHNETSLVVPTPDSQNLYVEYDIRDESGYSNGQGFSWTDQSGNGRDATSVGNPTYSTGGSIDPAADTDGNDGWDATSWGTLSSNHTVYAVVDGFNYTTGSDQNIVDLGDYALTNDSNNSWRILNSANDLTVSNNGEILFTLINDSGSNTVTLRTDGNDRGDVSNSPSSSELQISYRNGGNYTEGLWAAVYVYDTAHSTSTASDVESYLNDRHNLGLTL